MFCRYAMKRHKLTTGWTTSVRGFTTAPLNWKSCLSVWRSLKRAGKLQKGGWRLPDTKLRSKKLWGHRYYIAAVGWFLFFIVVSYILSFYIIHLGVQCKEPGTTAKSAGQSQIPKASGGLPKRPGPGFISRFATDTGRQCHGGSKASEAGRGPGEGVRWCLRQGEEWHKKHGRKDKGATFVPSFEQ